jgi:hypothetical protein
MACQLAREDGCSKTNTNTSPKTKAAQKLQKRSRIQKRLDKKDTNNNFLMREAT